MKEVQKDPIRAKRLDEVYKHLFAHFGITSQKHLAEVLKVQRTGLSSAFNGNVANLTDNLFKKICAAFPGVFNLNYLLTGEGDLLTVEKDVKTEDTMKPAGGHSLPTNSSDATVLMSRTFEIMLKPILEAHTETIATLKKHIEDQDAQIKRQADIIASLQNIISELRTLPVVTNIEEDLSRYPFPVGVAENKETTRAQV